MRSTIELKPLLISPSLGTYGPDDIVPNCHILDLTITIDPTLVMINSDEMSKVFDYDPLISEIDKLIKDTHYETQEWLISRIVYACASCQAITAIELFLRKKPVMNKSGELGVRLVIEANDLSQLRRTKNLKVQ